MKQTIIVLIAIFLIAFSVNANKKQNINSHTNIRDKYQLIVNNVILSFSTGKNVSLKELQIAIPISQDEFSIYYSYTNPDKGKLINKIFYKMDTKIVENATKNQGDFFKLYLELSPFVDGEYAEGYYDDIDLIIIKNKDLFCKLYSSLSSGSKKNLIEYKKKYCK